ncbi:MAG TPA: prepilin-type N-terminal cleavage/methylation domain-containing protein [Polyangiales bacterium]
MQANPETVPTQHDLSAPAAAEAAVLARRARARLARQGMTLIEIMIVVVIMALVATGVGIAVIPQLQKAKIQQTKSAVQTVRSAVALYRATNNADCATMDQLLQDKAIDKSTSTRDSWDNDFRIECDGTDITVTSAGPDKEFETEDDV